MRASRSSGAANIANVGAVLNGAVLCHKPLAQVRIASQEIFCMLNFNHIAVGWVPLGANHLTFRWRHHGRSCLCSKVDAFVHGYLAGKRIVAQSKAAGKTEVTLNWDADRQCL